MGKDRIADAVPFFRIDCLIDKIRRRRKVGRPLGSFDRKMRTSRMRRLCLSFKHFVRLSRRKPRNRRPLARRRAYAAGGYSHERALFHLWSNVSAWQRRRRYVSRSSCRRNFARLPSACRIACLPRLRPLPPNSDLQPIDTRCPPRYRQCALSERSRLRPVHPVRRRLYCRVLRFTASLRRSASVAPLTNCDYVYIDPPWRGNGSRTLYIRSFRSNARLHGAGTKPNIARTAPMRIYRNVRGSMHSRPTAWVFKASRRTLHAIYCHQNGAGFRRLLDLLRALRRVRPALNRNAPRSKR